MTRSQPIILAILSEKHRHLSATEIWEIARKRNMEVSLATVYNSLRSLVEAGEVREIQRAGESAVYDARLEAHAHLLCTACGTLADIDITRGVSTLEREARELSGYQELRSDITLRGICPACSKSH